MIVSIGEILFDIFPEYRRIGGAPFNFAYHILNMGIQVNFITRVGEDESGRDILNFMELHGFNISNVQKDAQHETGRVIVSLDPEGNPEFNIVTKVAYDFIEFNAPISQLLQLKPDLIYFGTLAQRTEPGFETIQQILSARAQGTHCIYDVNLRPHSYSEQTIMASLRQCDVVKMSEEELRILKKMHRFFGSDEDFIDYILEAYKIEMVSLTRGKKGSSLYTAANSYHQETTSRATVADTVGAGDAYAAVLAVGYVNHWTPERIVKASAKLAERICGIKGAIPKDAEFYKDVRDTLEESV